MVAINCIIVLQMVALKYYPNSRRNRGKIDMFTESDVKIISDLVKTLSCLCKPCLSIKQVKNKTNLFTYESGSPCVVIA